MESVFVTGVNGFLGSQLALKLAKDGYRVVGLVKDKNYKTRRDILDKISIVYGDIRDFDAVRYCVSRYEVDTVFHLAATTIIKQSVIDPITTYASNVMGTVNVLEAARQAGKRISKVVVASSDKAYGNQPVMPYVEDMNMMASDPYSSSKACTDIIARSFALTHDMNISVIRAGNIYGPGDLNLSRLIPGSAIRISQGKQPTIYKGVGEYKREWMYIDDVIDAYLAVAARGGPAEAYNVGGSGFQTIFDTVDMMLKIAGSNLKPEIIDKDFIEIKEQYLDATKLMGLGWKCKFKVEDGLKVTMPWYAAYAANKTEHYFG